MDFSDPIECARFNLLFDLLIQVNSDQVPRSNEPDQGLLMQFLVCMAADCLDGALSGSYPVPTETEMRQRAALVQQLYADFQARVERSQRRGPLPPKRKRIR